MSLITSKMVNETTSILHTLFFVDKLCSPPAAFSVLATEEWLRLAMELQLIQDEDLLPVDVQKKRILVDISQRLLQYISPEEMQEFEKILLLQQVDFPLQTWQRATHIVHQVFQRESINLFEVHSTLMGRSFDPPSEIKYDSSTYKVDYSHPVYQKLSIWSLLLKPNTGARQGKYYTVFSKLTNHQMIERIFEVLSAFEIPTADMRAIIRFFSSNKKHRSNISHLWDKKLGYFVQIPFQRDPITSQWTCIRKEKKQVDSIRDKQTTIKTPKEQDALEHIVHHLLFEIIITYDAVVLNKDEILQQLKARLPFRETPALHKYIDKAVTKMINILERS